MALITFPDGSKQLVTAENYRDKLRLKLQLERARGRNIDEAAELSAWERLIAAEAGTGSTVYTPSAAEREVHATAARLSLNPFVRVSDFAMGSLPGSAAAVLTDTSNGIIAAGKAVAGAVAAAARQLPDAAKRANTTLRIVAISAAVVVGGGAAVYLLHTTGVLRKRK